MTAIHGVSDEEIATQVGRIRPVASVAEAAEVFSRIAWSGICEPGDRVAGLLIGSVGATQALNLLIDACGAYRVAREIHESTSTTIDSEAMSELRNLVDEGLARWRPRLSSSDAMAHIARAVNVGAGIVAPSDDDWPQSLDDLGLHRPTLLWFRGKRERVSEVREAVSIVGARASTGYGEHVTMDLVTGLTERQLTVVSGAAYGIDGMAHRAALAGEGKTLAVLAGGIDRLYPSGHDTLLRRIIEVGVVVTELPCGFAPTKWRFLQRNRLIAALGRATVVVEAGWRSGSLNTAHHALELERPVGAVPGPVTSAASAGCHRLLRETPAVCVTTVEDVITLAGLSGDVTASSSLAGAEGSNVDSTHTDLIRLGDAMSERRARDVDELARATGMSPSDVRSALGLASLRGDVRETSQGWLRVRHAPGS